MKKILALPFKIVSSVLLITALLVLIIGGLILKGPKATSENLSKLSKALDVLKD